MFQGLKRAAASVANAKIGKLKLFPDIDGFWKTKDESGVIKFLGDGIASVSLVNTVGKVKTYRLTRESGATFDYTVTDGQDGAVLSLAAGTGISVTGATGNITITNTDRGSTAVATHESAVDPHPQYVTPAEAVAAFQPLDGTLSALAGQNWAANTLPVGSGTDTVSQVAFAANTAPARSSTGNLVAKSITDYAIETLWNVANAAGLTALINLATSTLKGLMSPAQFTKLTGWYDAQADFGFVGDMVSVFDGAMTSGSAVLNCATSAPFAATDVGKRITVARAGASGAQLTTTILSYQSPSQVTLAASAESTTSGLCGVGFGTDNTAAVNLMVSTINGLLFPGAKVFFGDSATNRYGFPVPAPFTKTVQLVGIGGGHTADTGDYTRIGGTCLAWNGASSDGGVDFGAMISFNPTGVQSIKRPSLRHLWLDCRNGDQNQGLMALKMRSCQGWTLEDAFICDALAVGLSLNIGSTPTEAKDNTRFSARDICFRQLDNTATPAPVLSGVTCTTAITLTTSGQSLGVTANSLPAAGYAWVATTIGRPALIKYTGGGGTTTLTGVTCAPESVIHQFTTVSGGNIVQCQPGNAALIVADGGSGANTCCGVFDMIQASFGTTWGPAALDLGNSDSITFRSIRGNGGDNTDDGLINRRRRPGVRLAGSQVSDTLASRNNVFDTIDPGGSPTGPLGGISVMGLLNTGAAMAFPSGPNYCNFYELGNGAPLPVVEGEAHFDWQGNGCFRVGPLGPTVFPAQAIAAATATYISGSAIKALPQSWQPGLILEWEIDLTGGAAGTAPNVITLRVGTAGTTADATVATLTTGNGTANASTAKIRARLHLNTVGATPTGFFSAEVINGPLGFTVNTQFLDAAVASFPSTATANLKAGIVLQTGAAKTATINKVSRFCRKAANP